MKKWLRWLFRRGERGVLVLNMAPGDRVADMCVYRDWLAVASERGEIYLIQGDQFVHGFEVPDMTVFKR